MALSKQQIVIIAILLAVALLFSPLIALIGAILYFIFGWRVSR